MGIKVNLDFKRMRVDLEGEAADILEVYKALKDIAPKFEEVRIFAPGKMPNESESDSKAENPPTRDEISARSVQRPVGLRDFVKPLPLDSHFIRIAAIAFYQREYASKSGFSAREMNDWFGLCGFQKPQAMPVALSDTQRRREFVKNDGRDRWVLTTTGENAVRRLIED